MTSERPSVESTQFWSRGCPRQLGNKVVQTPRFLLVQIIRALDHNLGILRCNLGDLLHWWEETQRFVVGGKKKTKFGLVSDDRIFVRVPLQNLLVCFFLLIGISRQKSQRPCQRVGSCLVSCEEIYVGISDNFI